MYELLLHRLPERAHGACAYGGWMQWQCVQEGAVREVVAAKWCCGVSEYLCADGLKVRVRLGVTVGGLFFG